MIRRRTFCCNVKQRATRVMSQHCYIAGNNRAISPRRRIVQHFSIKPKKVTTLHSHTVERFSDVQFQLSTYFVTVNVCKRSSGWIRYDNHTHITQPSAKYMYLIATFRRLTVFWSRAHRQRHVTICLMKFAVAERNVAIRYIYFAHGCVFVTVVLYTNRAA